MSSFRSVLNSIITLGKGVSRGLPDASEDRDPIELFQEWYRAAERSGLVLPEAMTVATATPDGYPSARMCLLKGIDARGFVFYTNYGSRKAQELEANPRAALVFHWGVLQRQVRVEGAVERLDPDESFAYFDSRPRGSRIGAWASRQSEVLPGRQTLQERVRHYEEKFKGRDEVPLPPFWGGFRVAPRRIEFWQGRSDRLHDRLRFVRTDDGWDTERLYP